MLESISSSDSLSPRSRQNALPGSLGEGSKPSLKHSGFSSRPSFFASEERVGERPRHTLGWLKTKYFDKVVDSLERGNYEYLASKYLDWVEETWYAEFRITDMQSDSHKTHYKYFEVPKRGNGLYAWKTRERLKFLKEVDLSNFSEPVREGSDKLYWTRLLFVGLTVDRKEYGMLEAWEALGDRVMWYEEENDLSVKEKLESSTWRLNSDNRWEHKKVLSGEYSKLRANWRKKLGSFNAIRTYEGCKDWYPAPHMIILLKRPRLVKKHKDKDGSVSYRLFSYEFKKELGSYWSMGFIDIQGVVNGKITANGEKKNVIAYLTKYFTKSLKVNKEAKEGKWFMNAKVSTLVMNWWYGYHSFSVSGEFKDRYLRYRSDLIPSCEVKTRKFQEMFLGGKFQVVSVEFLGIVVLPPPSEG